MSKFDSTWNENFAVSLRTPKRAELRSKKRAQLHSSVSNVTSLLVQAKKLISDNYEPVPFTVFYSFIQDVHALMC